MEQRNFQDIRIEFLTLEGKRVVFNPYRTNVLNTSSTIYNWKITPWAFAQFLGPMHSSTPIFHFLGPGALPSDCL